MVDEEKAMSKDLQKFYFQLQVLEQQGQQLQQQLQAIGQQVEELEHVKEGLEQLQNVKPGTEIFVPFAGGVFVKAELKDSQQLLLNVGAGTAILKSVPETITTIMSQIDDMAGLRQQMTEQLERVYAKAQDISQQMEKSA